MLDIISEIIGSTALIAGNFLYSLFPFLPVSIAENPATIMVIVGFGGQLLFAMRFLIQWIFFDRWRISAFILRTLAQRPCYYLWSRFRAFYLRTKSVFYIPKLNQVIYSIKNTTLQTSIAHLKQDVPFIL